MKSLKELCMMDGISGREQHVAAYIAGEAKKYCQRVEIDPLGNVIAEKKGADVPRRKIMFAAHMDEVGFMLTAENEDGTFSFGTVGGIDTSVLAGKRVRLCKDGSSGVIITPPVHLVDKENGEKPFSLDALAMDFPGESIPQVGDAVVFDSGFYTMGEYLCGKAIDDRFGCLVLLEMMQQELPYDVTFAFTVQEEVGCRGAAAVAHTIAPQIAVVVEATTAADLPGVAQGKKVCCLKKGPVIPFMDGMTVYDKKLHEVAREYAREQGIPDQTKSVISGGNDAGRIQIAAGGVRVLAVSIPCRYLHSPSCMVHEEDMENMIKLCTGLVSVLEERG